MWFPPTSPNSWINKRYEHPSERPPVPAIGGTNADPAVSRVPDAAPAPVGVTPASTLPAVPPEV